MFGKYNIYYSASIGSFLLLEHIRKKMKQEIQEKFGQQQADYVA